jgi:hypothetical protein
MSASHQHGVVPLRWQMLRPARHAPVLDFSAFYAENAEAVLVYLAPTLLGPGGRCRPDGRDLR